MINLMTQFRLNKAIFFVLAMALLSMQWSTAHIHLAEHHDHDGIDHQHQVKTHVHQSFSHNDSVDSNKQIFLQPINVVDLDHGCHVFRWNNIDDQPVVLTSASLQLNIYPHTNSLESASLSSSKRRYLDYSTINLRAPPIFT